MNQLITPRESQVAELLSFGYSYKEIAGMIGVSAETVDTHIKNLKRKTGLQKASEITLAVIYKKHHISVFELPEKVRRRIAAALLLLSVFTTVMHTSDFLRVLRPANSVRTARTARTGARRNGKSQNFYLLNVA